MKRPSERRILTYDGAGRVTVSEEPVPEIKPGSVLVEVTSSLISPGTEMKGIRDRRGDPQPDAKSASFGYGNAGVILEVGENCRDLKPGMRVACMGGGYAPHATYEVVPVNLAIPIPEGVSEDEASFAHLAATALQAVRRADIEFGQNLAVMGLGIVGNLSAKLSKLCGAHVMGIDPNGFRRSIAEKSPIDMILDPGNDDIVEKCREFSTGFGMDTVTIAFGGEASDAIDLCTKIIKKAPDKHQMGTIVIVGGATFTKRFPTPFGNVDIRPSCRTGPGYHDEDWEFGRDYDSTLVQWNTRRNVIECLRAVAEKRLTVEDLVTHRLPMDKAPWGCDQLIDSPDTTLGVIIHPQE